jgi:hypothetical protein
LFQNRQNRFKITIFFKNKKCENQVAATLGGGVAIWSVDDGISIGVVDYTSKLTGG